MAKAVESPVAALTPEVFDDARARVAPAVHHTPLLHSSTLSQLTGYDVWLKAELFQRGGSYKVRGPSNKLPQLPPEQRRNGVICSSAGNHAQGVAIAANRLGIPATIVMPADAPRIKIDNTRSHGAKIVFYDRQTENREEISARLAAEKGAVVVPSFDDPNIVAGQGSVGLEVLKQLEDLAETPPPAIAVPVGGGGLAAGIALACPESDIVGAEPEGWDDMRRSLEGGEIVPVGKDAPPTLCDALQTPRVSPITFDILRDRNAQMVAISEAEVAEAVKWAWKHHQLTVEPGGAAALAAVLSGKTAPRRGMVVILSGGNIDPALHARIIA